MLFAVGDSHCMRSGGVRAPARSLAGQQPSFQRVRFQVWGTTRDSHFMIVDTAFAMDGGSLGLSLTEGGLVSHYWMNRSIASLGTPKCNEISSESSVISSEERRTLLCRLQLLRGELVDADPNVYVIDEFLNVLSQV